MTWRDEMRPASFRGVPFFVERADRHLDLLADEHVFAGREEAARAVSVVQLGLGAERHQIRAYVIGDDYRERRDALEAALAEQSAGRLVHPYRGERTVKIVGRISTQEGPERGGYALITFSAVDHSEAGLRSEIDTSEIADRDLDAFLEDTAADFETTLDEAAVPNAYMGPVNDGWEGVTDALEDAHRTISNALGVVDDFAERVEDFSDALEDFVGAPAEAAAALLGAIDAVASLPGDVLAAGEASLGSVIAIGEEAVRAFEDMLGWGEDAPPVVTVTPGGEAADRLRRATFRVVRHGAWIGAARTALAVPFVSRDRALRARADLDAAAEALLLDPEGPGGASATVGAFEALAAARASMLRHLSAIAAAADEATTYTPATTAPALVVAHDLYGDAEREAEIVERNNPPHPGQIPGGTDLEVLR